MTLGITGFGQIDWKRGDHLEEENSTQRTLKMEVEHSFNRLYEVLRDHQSLTPVLEDQPVNYGVRKTREVVEITRDFEPEISETLNSLSRYLEGNEDTEAQETRRILQGVNGEKTLMV